MTAPLGFWVSLSFVAVVTLVDIGGAATPSADDPITCPSDTVLAERDADDGRTAWCLTEDGTAHGPQIKWYHGGVRRSEVHWVQGRKHGHAASWDESGALLEEAEWVDGEMHGIRSLWYVGGGRRSRTEYVKGLRDGQVAMWDEAGVQIVEGRHAADRRHGVWCFRGPRERASQAAFAVMIDDEDMTQGLLETPPTDCDAWTREQPLRRGGYLAVLALLSLRAADRRDIPDEFPVALCIARAGEQMSQHIDRTCAIRPKDFVEIVKLATVDLAVGCSH
jgi:hypothetical protein